jgi:hypothetical protein
MAMGAGPRADFVCLSRKCQKDGQQPTYELPVDATRCPCCGSKRIKRLFNAVNISEPGFFRVNRIVDVEVANALERKHDQRDADIARQKRGAPQLAVPIGHLGARLGQIHPAFGGVALDTNSGSRPAGEGFAHPISTQIRGRPPRPGPGSVDLGGKVEEV